MVTQDLTQVSESVLIIGSEKVCHSMFSDLRAKSLSFRPTNFTPIADDKRNRPKRQIHKNRHRKQSNPKPRQSETSNIKTSSVVQEGATVRDRKIRLQKKKKKKKIAGPEFGLLPVYPPAHRSHGTMTDVSSPPLYASTTLFNFFLRVGGVATAVSPSVATTALGAATWERRTCVVH